MCDNATYVTSPVSKNALYRVTNLLCQRGTHRDSGEGVIASGMFGLEYSVTNSLNISDMLGGLMRE